MLVTLYCKNDYRKTTGQVLYRLITAYTFIFYALVSMNIGFYRLVKINSVILKDTAFILSNNCHITAAELV